MEQVCPLTKYVCFRRTYSDYEDRGKADVTPHDPIVRSGGEGAGPKYMTERFTRSADAPAYCTRNRLHRIVVTMHRDIVSGGGSWVVECITR
mgnify:CR=1 FL=1